MQELDLAEPRTGEVLVALHACGVCHTVFVERYLAGDIDVDAFVSHRLGLEEVNRGFELMKAQDGIRSVIALR